MVMAMMVVMDSLGVDPGATLGAMEERMEGMVEIGVVSINTMEAREHMNK